MKHNDHLRSEIRSNRLAVGYLVIGLLSCVILTITLNTRAAGPWAFVAPVVGAAGLILQWQSAPVFVLLSTAIAVMITKESEFARPEFDDVLLALSLVCYSLALSRLVSLTKSIWPPDPRTSLQPRMSWTEPTTSWRQILLTLTIIIPIWRFLRPTTQPESAPRRLSGASPDELGVALLFPAIALAIAFAIWRVASALPVPLRVEESHWPVGIIVWLLIASAVMIRVVIGIIAARRMSAAQAQIILNDVVWTEHRRELHRIARYTPYTRIHPPRVEKEVRP